MLDLRTHEEIVGTGKADLWALESQQGGNPFLGLAHWDGSSVTHMPWPSEFPQQGGAVSLAAVDAGKVWAFAVAAGSGFQALQLDMSGAVIADRTADFPGVTSSSRVTARGGRGGLFVETFDSASHIYRLSGDEFVPVDLPAGLAGVFPNLVLGPDEAWFRGGVVGLYHYNAGTWTEAGSMLSLGQTFGSVDDQGVYYSLGTPATEQEQLGGDPPKAKLFINIVRVENEQPAMLRLHWADNEGLNYGFQPDAIIGLAGGGFGVLGQAQRSANGGPLFFDKTEVVRRGTAAAIETDDIAVHSWGECTTSCGSRGIGELFADGTFIVRGGPREDPAAGRNPLLLLGTAAELP